VCVQYCERCVTHASSRRKLSLRVDQKRDAYRAHVNKWILGIVMTELHDSFVEYTRGEGQIVSVRKCRINSVVEVCFASTRIRCFNLLYYRDLCSSLVSFEASVNLHKFSLLSFIIYIIYIFIYWIVTSVITVL